MYWWNVNALIEDFRAGRVSERQRMQYYLAGMLFLVVGIQLASSLPTEFTGWSLLELALGVVINAVGIRRCFDVNSRGDNADFVVRMLCLGWPISIRLLVVYVPIYMICAGGLSMTTSDIDFVSVLLNSALNIYTYKWLHSSLLKIAGQQTVPVPAGV